MSHDGDEAFKTSLISRYGQPQRVSGLPAVGLQTLSWTTSADEIEANFSKNDPAHVMQCAKTK